MQRVTEAAIGPTRGAQTRHPSSFGTYGGVVAGLQRKLTFSAWADASESASFDRIAAAEAMRDLDLDEQVLRHGDALTAVEVIQVGTSEKPTRLQLLALHDAETAPSAWGPGQGATVIDLGQGRYSAFITHVSIWPSKIAAHDGHANAPGLGRLSTYLAQQAEERVVFRALYEQGLSEQLDDLEGIRGVAFGIYSPHKKQAASGMVESLLPRLAPKVPAVRVSLGMSRRSPRDAYLPPELADEVFELADKAEQFFDALKIRGRSKTVKTPAGKPKTVEVNLLSQRLHVPVEVPRDAENLSVPDRKQVFRALSRAHRELQASGKLAAAVEARILLDEQR